MLAGVWSKGTKKILNTDCVEILQVKVRPVQRDWHEFIGDSPELVFIARSVVRRERQIQCKSIQIKNNSTRLCSF